MSKVAIQGNALGTGTFTIAAPVGTGADRTLTLPDEAGTVLTSASSIPSSQITGSLGITMADQWYVNTTFSGTTNPVVNWTRVGTTDGGGSLGSAMTESSGIFTFPETGIYHIHFQARILNTTGDRAVDIFINSTTDGGTSYSEATNSTQNLAIAASGTNVAHASCSFIFDVQNTSTHKVKFTTDVTNSFTEFNGGTDRIRTGAFFVRLGDT